MSNRDYDLLLFGGRRDPNIACLYEAAIAQGYQVKLVTHDEHQEPALSWNLKSHECVLDGESLSAKSAFLRYDVFSASAQASPELDRAYGWFSAIMGACAASSSMRVPNIRMHLRANHKAFMLAWALQYQIPVPNTLISNQQKTIDEFSNAEGAIAKPVAGGAYCIELNEASTQTDWVDGLAPIPAIVQQKLIYPEFRVFRYGDDYMTFEIHSQHLDYRPHNDNVIQRVDNSALGEGVIKKLAAMSDALNIDFFACDFKTDPQSGQAQFLELNSGPMFAAYDQAAQGELAKGMARWLCHAAE